eukprot:354879-Chlamydomonas_euryale.AAC.1
MASVSQAACRGCSGAPAAAEHALLSKPSRAAAHCGGCGAGACALTRIPPRTQIRILSRKMLPGRTAERPLRTHRRACDQKCEAAAGACKPTTVPPVAASDGEKARSEGLSPVQSRPIANWLAGCQPALPTPHWT